MLSLLFPHLRAWEGAQVFAVAWGLGLRSSSFMLQSPVFVTFAWIHLCSQAAKYACFELLRNGNWISLAKISLQVLKAADHNSSGFSLFHWQSPSFTEWRLLPSGLFFFFSFRSSAKLVAPLGCLVSRQKHTLPDLPYDYAALEPHINAEIMQLHHSKHHATYVNNLNVAEEKYKEALAKGLYIHSQQGRWKLIGIDDTGELKKKKKKREMFSFKSFGLCHCNIVRRKSFIVASVVLIIGNQI